MQYIHSIKSLSRLWRQLSFVPILHNQWLTDELKVRLAQAITHAESGHRGEIYLVIENHLPISQAYRVDCRERALGLFGTHRVWDTAENTGVMIYVNICEHNLEIIADRGIDDCVGETVWTNLTQTALQSCQSGDFATALMTLIAQIGELLRRYYPGDDVSGNELDNEVVFLK
ncbi:MULTISPECIES: TPM domain-containing protein [unclassified Moraxella]|uniref:TPM domain-containing protein n=1 Tax=unclassified Moraxella TaxID=2685852 RepID=UPI00359DE743